MAPRVARFFWGVSALLASAACSSGSSDSSRSNADKSMNDMCEQAVILPCSSWADVTGCTNSLKEERAEAAAEGCRLEWDAYIACAAKNGVECEPFGDDLQANPACVNPLEAYKKCAGTSGTSCEGSGSSTSCTIDCTVFGVSCKPDGTTGTEWTCTCDSGPSIGQTYKTSAAEACDESTAESACSVQK